MRTDHQGAISAIKRATELLRASPMSSGDFCARLFDLTSILLENSLCAAALENVLASRAASRDTLERCRRSAVQSVKADVKTFVSGVLAIPEAVRMAKASIDVDSNVLGNASRILNEQITFGEASAPLYSILEELATDEQIDGLTVVKLGHIRTAVLSRGLEAIRPLANSLGLATSEAESILWVNRIEAASKRLNTQIADLVRRLGFAENLLASASLEPMVAELRRVHAETKALIDQGSLPTTDNDRLEALSRLQNFDVPTRQALLVSHLVEARLHLGVVESHSLTRLRVHLERFGKNQLLADFDAEERETGNRRFEARLQDRVDSFLFAEGLFPITHAEASGGQIDTFVAENQHVFEEVLQQHQIPVLLELKVVVRGETTKAKVFAQLDKALSQADAYAAHLRANPRWRDHQVTALVAYDGPMRFRTRRQGAMLVYLGNAKPHESATFLEDM